MNRRVLIELVSCETRDGWPLKTILTIVAFCIIVSSCVTPSQVRDGNRNQYLIDAEPNNSDYEPEQQGLESDHLDSELDFSQDLKETVEANSATTSDLNLEIPEISKEEADEIAMLTKELVERNPSFQKKINTNEKNTPTSVATTGLPTLQNQVNAINETFIQQSELIEEISDNFIVMEEKVDAIDKDVKTLKKQVSEIIQDRKSTPLKSHSSEKDKTKSKKQLTGYKLLSDEALADKQKDSKKEVANKSPVLKQTNTNQNNEGINDLNELLKSMTYKVAMNSISKKDYRNATRQLDRLRSNYKKGTTAAAEIDYWLGESAYGLKQYKKALQLFRNATDDRTGRADNASAMVAECMIKLGKIKEAKQEYKNFIIQYPTSAFIPRARKMLQQL